MLQLHKCYCLRYTDLFEGAAGEDGAVSLGQLQDDLARLLFGHPFTHHTPACQRHSQSEWRGLLAATQDERQRRPLDEYNEGGHGCQCSTCVWHGTRPHGLMSGWLVTFKAKMISKLCLTCLCATSATDLMH